MDETRRCGEYNKCKHWSQINVRMLAAPCVDRLLIEPESCGISNETFFVGKMLETCDKLRRCMCFIQRYPEGCLFQADNEPCSECEQPCEKGNGHREDKLPLMREFHRAESSLFHKYNWSGICADHRKAQGGTCDCHFRDASAAAHYLGSSIEGFGQDCMKDYEFPILPKHDRKRLFQGRTYLRYLCESTGQTELAFPVYISERPIGVFVVGQILLGENGADGKPIPNENIKTFERRKAQLQSNADVHVEHEEDVDRVIQSMMDAIEPIEELYEKLRFSRLSAFRLEVQEEALKKYTDDQQIPRQNVSAQSMEQLKERNGNLSSEVRNSMRILCEKTGIRKALMLYLHTLPNQPPKWSYLNIAGFEDVDLLKSGLAQTMLVGWHKQGHLFTKWAALLDSLDRLNWSWPEDNTLCWVPGFQQNGTPPYLFMLDLRGSCLEIIGTDLFSKETETLARNLLRGVCNYYLTKYSEYQSDFHKARMQTFVTTLRHELGQSHSGTKILLDIYRKDCEDYFGVGDFGSRNYPSSQTVDPFEKKTRNIINDTESYLHSSMLRISGSRYLNGVPDPVYKLFYPYETFLYKWRYIYIREAQEKDIVFDMDTVKKADESRPRMRADPDMIEQVAYNLSSNAFKYAMPGSRVSMDCKLNQSGNRYELTVVNYARPIEESLESIFMEGVRGSNHEEAGNGMGLYLSRQIAERHKGTLTVKQEIVSEYCLPMIDAYLNMDPKWKFDKTLEQTLSNEKNHLIMKKKWFLAIGMPIHTNQFTPLAIREHISKPTARIEFKLSIPHHKKDR